MSLLLFILKFIFNDRCHAELTLPISSANFFISGKLIPHFSYLLPPPIYSFLTLLVWFSRHFFDLMQTTQPTQLHFFYCSFYRLSVQFVSFLVTTQIFNKNLISTLAMLLLFLHDVALLVSIFIFINFWYFFSR